MTSALLIAALPDPTGGLALFVYFCIFLVVAVLVTFKKYYIVVGPDTAIVKSGLGGLDVKTAGGKFIVPMLHRYEFMDLTLKSFEISRQGSEGLICCDNIRADIKVAFFIRVDNTDEEMKEVAQSIGARRCSELETLRELFDAKFSEALKTVGKQFDFVDLYDQRDKFKDEILKVIGTDLNGYRLDDAAIDYLEQTPLELLSPNNILDAEGIKKITELTASEKVKENQFTRNKEKTLKKQDVEAEETILALERQRVEAVEKQKREIAEITSRENASAAKVREEQRLESERARIQTEEEIGIAEENKSRQVLVAQRNKERTDAVELERVTRDRDLEMTERLRVVGVAEVEKEKAIEVEKRNIQEVIRERVAVERAVVEEQERIKDTEEIAKAERTKKVQVTAAEMRAQEELIRQTQQAQAEKDSSELLAEKIRIEADARKDAAEKETAAMKMLAEAEAAQAAATGLAEATVQEAKAASLEKEGSAEASVLQKKAVAEAKGIEAKADAIEKQGLAEANVSLREVPQRGDRYHREGRSDEATRQRRQGARRVQVETRQGKGCRNRGDQCTTWYRRKPSGCGRRCFAIRTNRHCWRRWRVLRTDHVGGQRWKGDRPVRLQQQGGHRHQRYIL